MRKTLPADRQIRIRHKFLWFPKTIGGVRIWLERARWIEVSHACSFYTDWRECCWLDDHLRAVIPTHGHDLWYGSYRHLIEGLFFTTSGTEAK
jgi:hypothetical protein